MSISDRSLNLFGSHRDQGNHDTERGEQRTCAGCCQRDIVVGKNASSDAHFDM